MLPVHQYESPRIRMTDILVDDYSANIIRMIADVDDELHLRMVEFFEHELETMDYDKLEELFLERGHEL